MIQFDEKGGQCNGREGVFARALDVTRAALIESSSCCGTHRSRGDADIP